MATIVTRTGKGSALTNTELDANFTNINTELGQKAVTGANTFTGNQTLGDNKIIQAMLQDIGHVFLDKGNTGTTAQTFDYTAGGHQKTTATGNHSWSLSNFPPSGNTGFLLIEAANWGAYTVTFPTINWINPDRTTTTSWATYLANLAAAGGPSTLASSGTNWFLIWSRDGGTTYYGKLL